MSDAVNLRIDPRTGEKNWTDAFSEELVVEEFPELPGVFGVILTQVPHPTSIEVYRALDPSVALDRVFTVTEPSASQFWSDSQQLKPRGYVIVNSTLYGEGLIIVYRGGGYLAHKRNLEEVIPVGPPGPPGGVDSVFGRSGNVVAVAGDYDLSEVDETGTYKRYTATEQAKLSGISTGADVTGAAITAAAAASIANADEIGFWQIVGSVLKKITWANLKAALASVFVTIPTYITGQATPTRVTGAAPDALGEYRSYLRNAGARTYTETNGSPTTAPGSTNGYKLYNGNAFASADTNNEPSKYEVFIGTGKTPVFEFYKNTGRTGLICTDIFPNWAGANDVGCATGYDPVTGIAFVTITQNGNQCAPGLDENGVPIIADIYFDIKC